MSKTIASFLAAAVDTAKDPSLSSLNINIFTGKAAMVLARLGFDTETIGLFLSQPIVVAMTNRYYENAAGMDVHYGLRDITDILEELYGVAGAHAYDTGSIKGNAITKDTLEMHLGEVLQEVPTQSEKIFRDSAMFQASVGKMFLALYRMGNDLNKLTYLTMFNSVTNAGGPEIADTQYAKDRVQTFYKDLEYEMFYQSDRNPNWTDVRSLIDNDPILKAFYDNTIGGNSVIDMLMRPFFPQYFDGFNKLLSRFKYIFNKDKTTIDPMLYNKLCDAYIYYMLTYETDGNKYVIPHTEEEIKELTTGYNYGMIKEFNLARDVWEVHRDDLPRNIIMDNALTGVGLRIKSASQWMPVDLLIFDSQGFDSTQIDKVADAWSELITMNNPNLSEEENRIIRNFANDLFFYSLMRGGFTYNAKTMMHMASVLVKINAKFANSSQRYVDGYRNLRIVDNELSRNDRLVDRMIDQFVRNNYRNQIIVPVVTYDSSIMTREGNKLIIKGETEELKDKIIDIYGNSRKYITMFITENDKRIRKFYMLQDRTYSRFTAKTTLTYEEIQPLGLDRAFIEYNANKDIKTSVFYDYSIQSSHSSLYI